MRTVPDVKPYAGNPHVLDYVVLVVLAFYCIISTMLYLNYVRPDYRALLCLTGCEHETEVLEFFGWKPHSPQGPGLYKPKCAAVLCVC